MRLLIESQDADGILKRKLKKVDVESELSNSIEELIEMVKIMEDNNGIGLTANQVNIDKSMFIQYMDGKIEFVINPQILKYSNSKSTMTEGCLSYPDKQVSVTRAREVLVKYHNGKKIVTKTLKGMNAIIFQHEFDHCKGECIVGRDK